jgi:hypothetical protein
VQARAGLDDGYDDLRVSPTNAGAREGSAVPFDELSCLFRAGAWEVGKGCQISRNPFGQARTELQLAQDNVTSSNPLLRKKQD